MVVFKKYVIIPWCFCKLCVSVSCLPGGGKVRGGSGAFFLLLLVGLRPPSLDTAAGVRAFLYTNSYYTHSKIKYLIQGMCIKAHFNLMLTLSHCN